MTAVIATLEFEVVGEWPEMKDQGINRITLHADGTLFVEGWYDDIATWGADVVLSSEQRSTLAAALGGDA